MEKWYFTMNSKTLRKNDLILIAILVGTLAIISVILLLVRDPGNSVVVSVDGVKKHTFPLDENLEFEIEGYEGGKNFLVIEDGEAYLTDASCPDHLCVHMGKISNVGQSIICLPNRVVVEIVGEKNEAEGGVDTMAR